MLFVLVSLVGFPHFLYAQLQDSHFYKVSEDEISSNFKIDSFWKTHIEGSFLKNERSREKLMKVKMYGKFDVEFNSYISARFEPYIVLQEGEIQSRFQRDEPSILQMQQGFFEIKPAERFSIQLGSIDQSYLNAPLLVSDQSFISALFAYSYIKEHYEVQTVLQQSMLSVVNSFRRYNEIEDVPYFTSLFTYGEWIPSDFYSFKGHITGFYFTSLPSFVANDSMTYGNTVLRQQSSAQFVHDYYGAHFDLSAQLRVIKEIYLSLGYNGLMNLGVPFAFDKAWYDKAWGERVYSILDIDLWKFAKMYSRFEYFYNSSDTAPAYYNSEIYGHNDRQGFLTELKVFFPKGNFEVGFRYVFSKPIQGRIIDSSIDKSQHAFMVFVSSRYLSI